MFIWPCVPTPSKRAPTGPEWVHEIKHDSYRLIVRRDGRACGSTRAGAFNWSHRFPLIADALRRLKARSATIDGVVCGQDGRPDFDLLHDRCHDEVAILIAFDLLELDGDDWRPM